MDEKQAQPTLTESWRVVREQRKRMEVRVVQLSALEVAEFTQAARHIVEVAEELQVVAKHEHLPRLQDAVKRFAWAAGRAAEASEHLESCLAREGLTPPSIDVVSTVPDADGEIAAALDSVEAELRQIDPTDNGRAISRVTE